MFSTDMFYKEFVVSLWKIQETISLKKTWSARQGVLLGCMSFHCVSFAIAFVKIHKKEQQWYVLTGIQCHLYNITSATDSTLALRVWTRLIPAEKECQCHSIGRFGTEECVCSLQPYASLSWSGQMTARRYTLSLSSQREVEDCLGAKKSAREGVISSKQL